MAAIHFSCDHANGNALEAQRFYAQLFKNEHYLIMAYSHVFMNVYENMAIKKKPVDYGSAQEEGTIPLEESIHNFVGEFLEKILLEF